MSKQHTHPKQPSAGSRQRHLRLAALAVALLGGAVVALVSVVAAQTTGPGEATVRILIVGSSESPQLQVTPRAVGICRNPTVDCDGEATWRLQGRPLQEGETIRVSRKDGSEACFEDEPFTLSSTESAAESGPPTCDPGSTWFYDVELLEDGEVKASVDPAIVIDR